MAKCGCGCGGEVAIAKRNNPKFGHVKGQPVRFIPGHHRRGAYPSLEERFRSRVDVRGVDDCWEWSAGRVSAGYGAVWDNSIGRHRHAHRLAWEIVNGPIPDGQWVLHRCDNPPCCNPSHLFLGTQADNDADRTAKGRGIHGVSHPYAKLTPDSVREIRSRIAGGEIPSALAIEFGVSSSTLYDMIHGKTWRHIA